MEVGSALGAVENLGRNMRCFTKLVGKIIAEDEKLEIVGIKRRQLRGFGKDAANRHDEEKE